MRGDRKVMPRIVIDPSVCGGRPIVSGTRMRVSDVLDALASPGSVEELLADFPYMTREDVNACPAYGAPSAIRVLLSRAGEGQLA